MAELHKFLFEGLPVRGMLVRLTDAWQTVLARRAQDVEGQPLRALGADARKPLELFDEFLE